MITGDAFSSEHIAKTLEAGVTQRIPNPRESMREVISGSKPSESRVVRPGPKPILPDISNRKTTVGPTPASTAETQKIPVVKSFMPQVVEKKKPKLKSMPSVRCIR